MLLALLIIVRQDKVHLSVIVLVYNIPREAPRTLLSLSAAYQRHVDASDYEVIVVDNGSQPPFDCNGLNSLAGNFRLIRLDPASPSPAHAINCGLAEAGGEIIGVMIDGARIVTPGLLHFARQGAQLYHRAIVATLGWYLGNDLQRRSMTTGYDQRREDALLASIEWPQDGYRLFEISTFDESSVDGWLQPIFESNALFMHRRLWHELGGVDEQFDAPGGGLVNFDTLSRALELPGVEPVFLLGEGTFHQFHGGVATNRPAEEMRSNFRLWGEQYKAIRGRSWVPTPLTAPRTFLGTLPRPALARFAKAAIHPPPPSPYEPPLGRYFDRELWTTKPCVLPADPVVSQLLGLAQREFCAGRYEAAAGVALMIRGRSPDDAEAQRLLSLTAAWLPMYGVRSPWRLDYHLALAKAHRLVGEDDLAAANYHAALSIDDDIAEAHSGLAELRMPGDPYLVWLERLYAWLMPKTVLEIGAGDGRSLSLAIPPTRLISVDSKVTLLTPLNTEAHLFPEASNDFFGRGGLDGLLAGDPLDIGLIDGVHLHEQALRNFMHLEAYCGPCSAILLHNTVPLDEATQARERTTTFYTGDIWKTVVCLKHYRPDLGIFTIATPPSGLTVVTGLDAKSRTLADHYEEATKRFLDMPFSDIEPRLEAILDIVPNEPEVVHERVRASGILERKPV